MKLEMQSNQTLTPSEVAEGVKLGVARVQIGDGCILLRVDDEVVVRSKITKSSLHLTIKLLETRGLCLTHSNIFGRIC